MSTLELFSQTSTSFDTLWIPQSMAEELFALEELIQVLTESNRKTLDLHSIIQIIEKLSTYVSEIKKVSLTLIKETAKLLVNLQLIDPIPEEIYLNVKEYVKSISSALIVPHVSHQNIESDLIGLMHEQLSSFKLDTSNPNAAISLEPLFIDTGALQAVQEWLSNGENKLIGTRVSIASPTVIQKSYNTEKRFLCPPIKCSTNIAQSSNAMQGVEKVKKIKQDVARISAYMQSINLGYFRNIYANAKFEEEFYISIKLDSVDYNGPTIKMISKPSKKKQSANSVCILSGSNIALFNRLRSQTVTTKYLLIDNEELVVDAIDWNQFKIWKIDRELYDAAESSSFIWKNETELNFVRVTGQEILYEDAIVLEHVESGVFLAPFIVQSFNKCIKEGDLVSPLHKVGLKTKDGYMYLFEETNELSAVKAKTIADSAIWTITSTESVTYNYYRYKQPEVTDFNDITMISISNVKIYEDEIELYGDNLSGKIIQVFFGDNEMCIIKVKGIESILLRRPLMSGSYPIVITQDGVLFDTGCTIELDDML